MDNFGVVFEGDILSLVPELITTCVVVLVTVHIFFFIQKLNILFSRGFLLVGYGMVCLAIASFVSILTDIPGMEGQVTELVFEFSMLGTALCMLMGITRLHNDAIGSQKEIEEVTDAVTTNVPLE